MTAPDRPVLLPAERVERWVSNFVDRHGGAELTVQDGRLCAAAGDGSTFVATLPWGESYDGPADAAAFGTVLRDAAPADWGVLLVRKGGFAVARLTGTTTVASKTGQRHVQGRTKAGGQSQQRFARRRDNQARQAYEAAAGHAVRLLTEPAVLAGPLVTGGDRAAIETVLEDPRLRGLAVDPRWLALPDPRRSVLEQGVAEALCALVEVANA